MGDRVAVPNVNHHTGTRVLPLTLLLIALLAACARPTSQVDTGGAGLQSSSSAQANPAGTARPTRVNIAIWAEPGGLQPKLTPNTGQANDNNVSFVVNSPLVVRVPSGDYEPRLATGIPTQDNGGWVINSDGTMTTTWTIQPDAVWHDGEPVVANDFVFASKVYADPSVVLNVRT